MVRVCCVCRKVEQEGKWLDPSTPNNHRVSHVYCPLCYENLMDELDRYALPKWSKSVYTVMSAGRHQAA